MWRRAPRQCWYPRLSTRTRPASCSRWGPGKSLCSQLAGCNAAVLQLWVHLAWGGPTTCCRGASELGPAVTCEHSHSRAQGPLQCAPFSAALPASCSRRGRNMGNSSPATSTLHTEAACACFTDNMMTMIDFGLGAGDCGDSWQGASMRGRHRPADRHRQDQVGRQQNASHTRLGPPLRHAQLVSGAGRASAWIAPPRICFGADKLGGPMVLQCQLLTLPGAGQLSALRAAFTVRAAVQGCHGRVGRGDDAPETQAGRVRNLPVQGKQPAVSAEWLTVGWGVRAQTCPHAWSM